MQDKQKFHQSLDSRQREKKKKKSVVSTKTLLCPPIHWRTCGKAYPYSNWSIVLKALLFIDGLAFQKIKEMYLWPRKMPHGGKSKRNSWVHVCPWDVSNWVNHDRHYESSCKWSSKLWHHAFINLAKPSRTTPHKH